MDASDAASADAGDPEGIHDEPGSPDEGKTIRASLQLPSGYVAIDSPVGRVVMRGGANVSAGGINDFEVGLIGASIVGAVAPQVVAPLIADSLRAPLPDVARAHGGFALPSRSSTFSHRTRRSSTPTESPHAGRAAASSTSSADGLGDLQGRVGGANGRPARRGECNAAQRRRRRSWPSARDAVIVLFSDHGGRMGLHSRRSAPFLPRCANAGQRGPIRRRTAPACRPAAAQRGISRDPRAGLERSGCSGPLILFAAVGILLADAVIVWVGTQGDFAFDFTCCYQQAAERALTDPATLYDWSDTYTFRYTPIGALLFAPLVPLSADAAAWVWLVVKLAVLALTAAWYSSRWSGNQRIGSSCCSCSPSRRSSTTSSSATSARSRSSPSWPWRAGRTRAEASRSAC